MHFRYGALLVLLCQGLLVESKTFIIRKDNIWDCDYKGYVPGGGVTSIGSIKAPKATIAKNGFADVMGKAEDAAALAETGIVFAHEVLDMFSKVAPTLGPMLGVFGAATGVLKSLTEVQPEDILNACNEAMGELTKDINDKILRMEGYVKSSVIDLEKNLINREYRYGFNLWTNCAKEASVELSNECQREAAATMAAYRPKFAVFAWKLKANQPLTGFEAREVEAYLPVFRAYANLMLMMLKPLIQTYEKDNSPTGRNHFNRYNNQFKSEVAFFTEYSQKAVAAIIKAHKGKGDGVCRSTIDCGPIKAIKEGWGIKVHTANSATCNCVVNDGTNQLCSIHLTIRKDGKKPSNYWVFPYHNCNTDEQAAKEYSTRLLVPQAVNYQKRNVPVINAYWQKQLLDFIPLWQKGMRQVAHDEPATVSDEPQQQQDPAFHFSERYRARMANAAKRQWRWATARGL